MSRIITLALLVSPILACIDLSGSLGGQRQIPDPCTPGGDYLWTTSSLEAETISPLPCPFTVLSNLDFVHFSFAVRGDIFDVTTNQYSYLYIYDVTKYQRGWTSALVVADPLNSMKALMNLSVSAQPGAYVPNSDYLVKDSAHFSVPTPYGWANGWAIMNGAARAGPGLMIGPSTVLASEPTQWRAQTDWDTASYTYRWIVDGVEVPNSNAARLTRSFSTVGTHTLKALAQRADMTVDTIVKTTYATIGVQFSGPGVVEPNVNHLWSVTPSGGTGPHSYAWYLDGQYLGTGSSVYMAFPPNEAHQFDVQVTDALSNQGTSNFQFYTTSEGGGPVELRSAPLPRRTLLSLKPGGAARPR